MLFLCLYFCSKLQSAETKKGKKGPGGAVKTKERDPVGEIQCGWSKGGDPGAVPRAGTLCFSSAESAQPIWAFHCFRAANVGSWKEVFVWDWQKSKTGNGREVSQHWLVTLCLLSPPAVGCISRAQPLAWLPSWACAQQSSLEGSSW